MEFFSWLLAVFSAALRLSVDTTQIILFLGIVAMEITAIFSPPKFKPAILAMETRLTTGRWALIALFAVVGTRLLLAPYWVWEDEHRARIAAETKIKNPAQLEQQHLAMKELIAKSIADGEKVLQAHKPSKEQADADIFNHDAAIWATTTDAMIERAYGKGEGAVFGSDAGLSSMSSNFPTTIVESWVKNRLRRLDELVTRVDSLPIRSDFDPSNFPWGCPDCSSVH